MTSANSSGWHINIPKELRLTTREKKKMKRKATEKLVATRNIA
jgi:hypothetical protein